jgi:indole-3-glycerol phosphate synthase
MDFPPAPRQLLENVRDLGILRALVESELERASRMEPFPAPQPALVRKGMGPFERALRQGPLPVIAEFKRASPSLGPFARDAQVGERLDSYRRGGAAAFSILAEPAQFLGRREDFAQARNLGIPILYKGFVVTGAHLEEARALGASAVLLIARILGEHLPAFAALARARGLEPLVEIHSMEEIPQARASRVRMVGWNARDLSDFSVRGGGAQALREAFPTQLLVRESGLRSPADLRGALAAGFDAVLVGEALMRHPDPAAFLAQVAP